MDDLFTLATLDKITALAILAAVALAVIKDKLIWHTRMESAESMWRERLAKAEGRADRWETVALEALTAGAQAGVKAAEVAVGVVSALPDPAKDMQDGKG